MKRGFAAILLLALGGAVAGAAQARHEPSVVQGETDWRKLATEADRMRLRNLRQTWLAALDGARGLDEGLIAAQPELFAPDRTLPDPIPPAGAYRCRVFKLGARDSALKRFVANPGVACRIDQGAAGLVLHEVGGAQRPRGIIFPADGARAVFLGTLALGDESKALGYGRDANRNLIGVVERIGARRWRLSLPAPRWESRLDLIELVPAD